MAKKKRTPRHEHCDCGWNRRDLGLSLAESGDVAGTAQFLAFVEREVTNIAFFGRQPAALSARLRDLGRDAKRLHEFAAGYAEAIKDQSKPAPRRARRK